MNVEISYACKYGMMKLLFSWANKKAFAFNPDWPMMSMII